MSGLTFAEQVKLVLSRKGMTIKQLAEEIEEATGMKMSRQNLTQRLGRDNFQEKDMRMIADILGCPFTLSIIDEPVVVEIDEPVVESVVVNEALIKQMEQAAKEEASRVEEAPEVGEEPEIKEEPEVEEVTKVEEEPEVEEAPEVEEEPEAEEVEGEEAEGEEELKVEVAPEVEEVQEVEDPDVEDIYQGGELKPDINPYTGMEYTTNSVRTHPSRLGYVQIYDRKTRSWEEMTDWAFLGYQERQKIALGRSYQEPTYLD